MVMNQYFSFTVYDRMEKKPHKTKFQEVSKRVCKMSCPLFDPNSVS